jgi:hypothetical protein
VFIYYTIIEKLENGKEEGREWRGPLKKYRAKLDI